jgi:hypothetical protein
MEFSTVGFPENDACFVPPKSSLKFILARWEITISIVILENDF